MGGIDVLGGTSTFSNGLNIEGAVLNVDNGLDVSGDTVLSNNLVVEGNTTLGTLGENPSDTLTIYADTSLSNNV